MDRVFTSGAAGSPPSAPSSPSTGYAAPGNPGTGTAATKPGPWWFHMITEELRKVIVDAGLTPDHTNVAQLSAAISALAGTTFASDAEAQALSITNEAISPGTLKTAFQGANQSIGGNGYQKLPGGLIIEWGSGTFTSTGGSVTFPLAFPSACRTIVTMPAGVASLNIYTGAGSISSSGFTGYTNTSSTTGYYIAIGN